MGIEQLGDVYGQLGHERLANGRPALRATDLVRVQLGPDGPAIGLLRPEPSIALFLRSLRVNDFDRDSQPGGRACVFDRFRSEEIDDFRNALLDYLKSQEIPLR